MTWLLIPSLHVINEVRESKIYPELNENYIKFDANVGFFFIIVGARK